MADRSVVQSGRYKAYPEYKDSGVEWVGEIPRHWGLLRGKWRFKSLKEVNRNLQCMDRLALTMRGVIERSIDSDDGLQPSAFTGYQIFEKDDLVFKLIDLENYKTSRVGLVFKKGIMSPAYIRLKPNKGMSSKFFYYFYFDLYLRGIYNQIGGQGVRSALNASDLLEIEICVPSREEQAEIADFLDYETAKIDTLIEKQQRLIELLTEKRQAVISHAVTKGLNPDVPMKDSGVEWLGEVPEHWISAKLKYYTNQIVDGAHFTPTYTDSGVPFLRVSDIHGSTIDKSNIKYIPLREHKVLIKRCNPEKGDLLLSKNGTIGVPKVVDWDWDFSIFVSLCLIKFKPKLLSSYAEYFFKSYEIKEQINGLIKQSTVINLHLDKIQNFWFSIPPISEQLEIIDYLNAQITKFDSLIDKAQTVIQLMQERRTALISAAVTGKIDVRDWVKPE